MSEMPSEPVLSWAANAVGAGVEVVGAKEIRKNCSPQPRRQPRCSPRSTTCTHRDCSPPTSTQSQADGQTGEIDAAPYGSVLASPAKGMIDLKPERKQDMKAKGKVG